jgi:4-methyl-5(b-hydroxyethyl)-thiazole monophosphate biosynthesis
VAVANGSEDMETVIIIDILRRAGLDVTVGKVLSEGDDQDNPLQVTLMNKVKLITDIQVDSSSSNYDMIVLPGGTEGAQNFFANEDFGNLLKKQNSDGKYIAAICASPAIVLEPLGLLKGEKATAYPSMIN